jgi:hypothetical protein
MHTLRVVKPWPVLICLFIVVALVSGCATQPTVLEPNPPGFWLGAWHGFTILFSLAGSVLLDVRIYAFPNAGLSYDIGFFLGASVFFGGGVLSSGAM